jgi:hypothetical protein
MTYPVNVNSDEARRRRDPSSRLVFLQEQLDALNELRSDGYFSEIVLFALNGLQAVGQLRNTAASDATLDDLESQYYDLVQSLVH